ncbi:hypothetical protein ACT47E_000717 [Enterococcus faecalis]|nr:hypothetical protein [Enterococcus faecalis]MDV7867674.1 hypothetical protein [Enterococcus faecalis]
MDYVILIGSIIAAIGLILLMMTTRFVWGGIGVILTVPRINL